MRRATGDPGRHGRVLARYLASADSPGKTPDEFWNEHLEAFRVGDYDRALQAGGKSIEAARRATAGRRPAGREGERYV